MEPITKSLPVPGAFFTFNREERNAVAILFGLLARRRNLKAFAALLDWHPADLADAEVSVEWTFLRDLWNHHSRQADSAELLRTAIRQTLQPDNAEWLAGCTILEFNTYFVAVPKPSADFIQSPGNWSVRRFALTIKSDQEFRRVCRFKWAFNIKPDLVIQTPSGDVLCIEAKWDSREGSYPASEAEKAIFRDRYCDPVSQTELQRYLVNEVLGFTGTFAYLARKNFITEAGQCITWRDLLKLLDLSEAPAFISDWCLLEIDGPTAPGSDDEPGPDDFYEYSFDDKGEPTIRLVSPEPHPRTP